MSKHDDLRAVLSPLCQGLFDYMSSLDHEGLNWDPKEAAEYLQKTVGPLEARLEAAEQHLAWHDCDGPCEYSERLAALAAQEKPQPREPQGWGT